MLKNSNAPKQYIKKKYLAEMTLVRAVQGKNTKSAAALINKKEDIYVQRRFNGPFCNTASK